MSNYSRYSSGRYNPSSSSRYGSSYSSNSSTTYSRSSLPSSATSSTSRLNRYPASRVSTYGSSYSDYRSPLTSSSYSTPVYSSTNYWSHRPVSATSSPSYSSSPREPRSSDKPSASSVTSRPSKPTNSTSTGRKPVEKPKPEAQQSAKIVKVDLMIEENAVDHHTDMYEMCQDGYVDDITLKSSPAQLVIRRGQDFKVKARLDRGYSRDDQIRIEATFGSLPMISKGTDVQIVTGEEAEAKAWSVKVDSFSDNEVVLAIITPATCPIGKWNLAIDTITTDDEGAVTEVMSERTKCEAYILFNAWCKDDLVYMDKADWRGEYVLNDTGKVYRGSSKQIYGMPWNFGQFESVSLQAALFLLDEISCLAATSRGNPVIMSRKLSALVNAQDDNGVLVGNWSGDYSGGKCPTAWNGSVAILKEYMKNKTPVSFGQCWVFSAVLTTLCRAIGLPARSVTNFASAHDTDGSMTIDYHYDENAEPISALDTDSVWNFHVWNEVWMARPDLKSGYGGWQAIDATPQETSDGIYCAGPASVVAIKNGDVGTSYDCQFIFAEVNADRVHWFKMKNGSVQKQYERAVVGKNISTKAIGINHTSSANRYNPDREDLTSQYKYPEGGDLERAAVWNAALMSTKPNVYFDDGAKKDVVLQTKDIDNVVLGSDLELPVVIKNQSRSSRTVHLTATLASVYYTGVTKKKLRKQSFQCVVPANSEEECVIVMKAEEYMDHLADHNYTMKINYIGSVTETKQIFTLQDDFRLRTIIPEAEASKDEVKVGEEFRVKVTFKNPINKTLTDCKFTFEAAGNMKPTTADFSDVPAGGSVAANCDVTARRVGHCVVIASFECKELADIQTQCVVEVKK